MRKAALSLFCLALLGLPATSAWAAKPPVVVELFTAQGCSSCGKANQVVADLADRDGVLALTYSVDYWDYLGWKDTFAKPVFADRQRAYAKKFALRDVPTPQVVVSGRVQASGAKAEAVDELIRTAAKAASNPPDMEFVGKTRIAVGSGPAPRGGGEVWLVRFDPRHQDIAVKRGDNRGQTLVHRNVVRELVRLGSWSGRPRLFRLPPAKDEGLESVIIVQGARGGRILGVLRSTQD
ncbi:MULTISPECIES: DUF1223 domain-containing protein [unclassified Caulobacter]|uniref:DUF1223 domain-containing protein n=1 Tax=unclassified Caulobacter TaxID=2648921 RepID=UPI000D39E198|nr:MULTISPECIES: DUF1223 domain-containing protein [unclassified Caulobacter]PTS89804.1 DUF1223 domain-containing protein [Caulobacter sp. HMWF009]PTT05564.1 DUF1223 domain-containing protein [Caulobacter sp. HMWF025]